MRRVRTSARRRWPYLILAYGCVGLGAAGVVVPGLPTTPFILVGAWAAGRGSDRLHRWLHEHRHFGPLLRDWREQRAVPPRAKAVAVALLVLSWSVLVMTADSRLLPVVMATFFSVVAAFLLTRPNPRRAAYDRESVHD